MTYDDIIRAFKQSFPEIKVDDYRPADRMANTILVWTKDTVLLVYYDESFECAFIIGQTPCRKR